jgi:hypothetical protein
MSVITVCVCIEARMKRRTVVKRDTVRIAALGNDEEGLTSEVHHVLA